MSNAVYPTLPGLAFGVVRSPKWKTRVDESASGREYRHALMAYPRNRYVLKYEFLRNTAAADELKTLAGFFNSRRGSFDSFLFTDPDDNSVTDQTFGLGDGVTTQFQLVRTWGGFVEPVFDINGSPTIKKAGATQVINTNYTINDSGLVTFLVAPTAGQLLTWTGSFYWRVRFTQDEAEFSKFMRDLWELGKVELLVVKP